MVLFENDYIVIEENDKKIYLRVLAKGLSIKAFNDIFDQLPRIKLTTFQMIQMALRDGTGQLLQIGDLKDIVELSVSSDDLYVYVMVNLEESNFRTKDEVAHLVKQALNENDIVYGIDEEKLMRMPYREKTLIAQGQPPVHGIDAKVSYYELSSSKPKASVDGKVNHYDLDLIDNVVIDEWLGKKVPATKGKSGMNVKGHSMIAKAGRDYKLRYDKHSVKLVVNEDKTEEIFSKINGAVKFEKGKILVDNHLLIEGDVDFNTGHIDFDGYVTIKGTVQDKFNVTATYDISIDGAMGIGAVGIIQSKKGSVLIKGGINGKGVAQVMAGRDVITKYANESFIEAGNNVHIGHYAMDSEIKAKKIMLPPDEGRIIGGRTVASHRIETGSIGNKYERPTRILVEGFERHVILETLVIYEAKNSEMSSMLKRLKKELDIFENNMNDLDERAITTYDYLLQRYENYYEEYNHIVYEMTRLKDVLQTKGEGEVNIQQDVFPKTMLEIKSLQRKIKDQMKGSFYVKDKTFYHNEN